MVFFFCVGRVRAIRSIGILCLVLNSFVLGRQPPARATQRDRMHPHAGGGLFDKLVCVRRPASIGAVRNLRDTRFWAINQTDMGAIDVKWVKGRMPSTDDPRQSNLELHPSLGASTHTSGLAIKYPLLFVSRFDFLF